MQDMLRLALKIEAVRFALKRRCRHLTGNSGGAIVISSNTQ